MHRIAHFRFGLGPAPQEAPSPRADLRGWLLAQAGRTPAPPQGQGLPSTEEAVGLFFARQREIRAAAREGREARFLGPAALADAEMLQRLDLARSTDAPLHERLALHWCNHFTVTRANFAGFFAGAMEREAIRPHMLGRFEALLAACTTHPAMLFYLDNRSSIGPNSPEGRRRRRGLNENLARELLELHTLGAEGGYSQEDVQEVARILTGWTVLADGSSGGRAGFHPDWHEPGARTVLGRRYPEGGAEQLTALLADLARHPATARHVTRRMARHFVGDRAPPALAEAMAETFRRSEGDLAAVTRTLLTHPASWTTPPARLRPPIEQVFSMGRILGGLPARPGLRRSLIAMGQPWLGAPSPAGWPEEDDAWAAPDAVKTRLDWALQLAAQIDPHHDARRLAEHCFAEALSAETRRALQRAASGGQAMTLLVMSPEFQRR